MRTLIKKESCILCYTYLIECKDKVSCKLIDNKQRGGLLYPICDIVTTVKVANRKIEILNF